jgi:hypothetical protein
MVLFTQAYRPAVLRGIHQVERGYRRPFGQFAALGLTIRLGRGRGGRGIQFVRLADSSVTAGWRSGS